MKRKLEFEAADRKMGMTAQEIRAALADCPPGLVPRAVPTWRTTIRTISYQVEQDGAAG